MRKLNQKIINLIKIVFLFYFSLISQIKSSSPLTCLNPEGQRVDWYVIILLQESFNKFAYSDNLHNLRVYNTTKENFPPLMQSMALNLGEYNYAVWNDDDIDEEHESFSTQAHSKGILAHNEVNGFYLIHSLPRFPYFASDKFHDDFPPNFGKYAQSFICVSMDLGNLSKVAYELKNIRPKIHEYNTSVLPGSEITKNIERLVGRKRPKKYAKVVELNSLEGQKFELFIKPNNHKFIPWDNEIPDFYKENFEVSTWTRPSVLEDDCGENKTINITELKIESMIYTQNQDHSKWGVSENILCIGDLNRTKSQLKRSGSVLCTISPKKARVFRQLVNRLSQTCFISSSKNENKEENLKFLD